MSYITYPDAAAFPFVNNHPGGYQLEEGFTKREQMALSILNGLVANTRVNNRVNNIPDEKMVSHAIKLADCLIVALNKPKDDVQHS